VGIVAEIEVLRWKNPNSISGKDKDFLFSQKSKLALEHTQPSTAGSSSCLKRLDV